MTKKSKRELMLENYFERKLEKLIIYNLIESSMKQPDEASYLNQIYCFLDVVTYGSS